MTFTPFEILQLTILPVKFIFIGVVILVVTTAVHLSPILLRKSIYDKEGNALPPGPPIRYAFLRKYLELSVDYWAKKYGTLFFIWMGDQLFVFISDPHITRNLLVVKGAAFSRKLYFQLSSVVEQSLHPSTERCGKFLNPRSTY